MATCKKSKSAAEKKAAPVKHIGIVKNDPWLEPFEGAICGRHDHALYKLNELTNGGKQTLSDFASGYLYFGLHKTSKGCVNGLRMPPISIWWVISMVGKKMRPTK